METTAVAHEGATRGRGDNVTERCYAILMGHKLLFSDKVVIFRFLSSLSGIIYKFDAKTSLLDNANKPGADGLRCFIDESPSLTHGL